MFLFCHVATPAAATTFPCCLQRSQNHERRRDFHENNNSIRLMRLTLHALCIKPNHSFISRDIHFLSGRLLKRKVLTTIYLQKTCLSDLDINNRHSNVIDLALWWKVLCSSFQGRETKTLMIWAGGKQYGNVKMSSRNGIQILV
jgi:hypothetical protein